jgi:hypothetical protein
MIVVELLAPQMQLMFDVRCSMFAVRSEQWLQRLMFLSRNSAWTGGGDGGGVGDNNKLMDVSEREREGERSVGIDQVSSKIMQQQKVRLCGGDRVDAKNALPNSQTT